MATVESTEFDGVKVVRVSGILSNLGADSISPLFLSEVEGAGRYVVDLSGVDMIATPGISLLLTAHQRVKAAGGRFVITGTRELVYDALRRCRLDTVLTLRPLDEAVRKAKE